MAFIMGMDFGNWFSYLCYVNDNQAFGGRLGSKPKDLLPNNRPNDNGYPSIFFYSKSAADKCTDPNRRPPWYGYEALRRKASPASHRVRGLKRKMGQPLQLDDWDGDVDKAITLLIQYLVREGNKVLQTEEMTTTNQLSLAYPATFNTAQVLHLKDLAQAATLEDGRHVQVVGMIAEPAAGALDYLAEHGHTDHDYTVLTYDLGGGTFDLAVVTAYPQGKTSASGGTYYYDVEKTGGLATVGGCDFDREMADLLRRKAPQNVRFDEEKLMVDAENAKIDLTDGTETEVSIIATDSRAVELTVTRDEFERAAAPLMRQTIEETRRVLAEYATTGKPAPEFIVLTGGASQMPMVRRELEENFPQFRGKVACYRPNRAIAYGAARYGTPVSDFVQMRVRYDLGIRLYHRNTDDLFVDVMIPAGSPLPFTSENNISETRAEDQMQSFFVVMEGRFDNPDPEEIDTDFRRIVSVSLDFGRKVPKGTECASRLIVDKNGLLTIEAREADDSAGSKPVSVSCQLENLSN